MEGCELSLVSEVEGDIAPLASLDKSSISYQSGGRGKASFDKSNHHRQGSSSQEAKAQAPSLRSYQARNAIEA